VLVKVERDLVNAKPKVDAVQQPCLGRLSQVKWRRKASLRVDTARSGEEETEVFINKIGHRRPPYNNATNITQFSSCEKGAVHGFNLFDLIDDGRRDFAVISVSFFSKEGMFQWRSGPRFPHSLW
jgi:hypothetical protein